MFPLKNLACKGFLRRVLLYALYSIALSSLRRFPHLHWTYTVNVSKDVRKCLLRIYCVESVYKMQLVLSVTFFISFAMYGVACVKLAHSSYGDREDMFITHLIVINKSEVLTISIVIFSVVVP